MSTQIHTSIVGALASLRLKIEDKSDDIATRMRITFPNGYQASVVRGPTSYGGAVGLFECAVMHHDRLVYDTPVCSDTRGHLGPEQVIEFCRQVAELPPRKRSKK